jgi:hypothetical protein
MKQIKIHREDGSVRTLEFPESASEWPLYRYIDYQVNLEKLNDHLTDETKREDPFFVYDTTMLKAKCVSEFLGVELVELFGLSANEVSPDKELALEQLFANIHQFNINAKADENQAYGVDYVFHYKGKNFHIHALHVDQMNNEKLDDISLGQLVNIMEMRRILYKSKSGKFSEADPDGSNKYTSNLSMIAALCVEVGKTFPTTPDLFEKHLQKNIEFFKDIDIQTALNIDFFLAVTLVTLEIATVSDTFGTLLKTSLPRPRKRLNGTVNKRKLRRKSSTV